MDTDWALLGYNKIVYKIMHGVNTIYFMWTKFVSFFNCCLSVHVDNYTIIIPTKCISFLLLKAQDITTCTFCLCILAPTCFNPRGSSSGGAMSVPS
jgi:hypothetical protein